MNWPSYGVTLAITLAVMVVLFLIGFGLAEVFNRIAWP